MQYRVVEAKDGTFYPQFKDGWLSRWRFFSRKSLSYVQSGAPLVRLIEARDPADRAKYNLRGEADAFISDIDRAADDYWSRRGTRVERVAEGTKPVCSRETKEDD